MVFPPFFRRPTLDLTAICSRFVGCGFFRKVGKSTKKDLQKSTKMAPKMQPEASQNPSKNEAKKKHEKSTIWATKMEPKWSLNGCPDNSRIAFFASRNPCQKKHDFLSILDALGSHFASFWTVFAPSLGVQSPDFDQN